MYAYTWPPRSPAMALMMPPTRLCDCRPRAMVLLLMGTMRSAMRLVAPTPAVAIQLPEASFASMPERSMRPENSCAVGDAVLLAEAPRESEGVGVPLSEPVRVVEGETLPELAVDEEAPGDAAGVAAEEASAEGAVAGVVAEEGRAARRARHGARVAVSSEPEGVPATAPAWQRLAALDAAASGDAGAEAGGFFGSTVELKLAVIRRLHLPPSSADCPPHHC